MKHIEIEDALITEHLRRLPQDCMDIFLLHASPLTGNLDEEWDNAVRGAFLNATALTNLMRSAHELGILESLILGQAYMGTLLMTRSLKGAGRLNLEIGCAGPVRGLSVEATAGGNVRGYLKQVPIPVEAPLDSFDTSPFFGPGILTVQRFADNSDVPFSGNIDLYYGNIGQDIARYYLVSEQTRTSISVSIKFDREGRIIGAGGLFIEALPGAQDGFLNEIQGRVSSIRSIGETIAEGTANTDILESVFAGYQLEPMEHRDVNFYCPCSRERFMSFIRSMKINDLEEIAQKGPFPLVTQCHNCNSAYSFSREEIRELLDSRKN
ncbi:Hsp33 family molecular chaperone HslO [Marispirochaeta sp.]|uniref:Hsp33 family molecular chaperone HslO n=1 Tax=Marispirochaeta sp. TaxID=2038653 RepID=UPI0029C7260C|nr:Hsp33 family molecular chaperone HslO [Marispirochaeta sp.]